MEPGQGSVRPTVMSMLTQFARAGLLVSLMSSLALASCGDGTAGTKGGEVLRSGAAYVLTGAAGAGDNIAAVGYATSLASTSRLLSRRIRRG